VVAGVRFTGRTSTGTPRPKSYSPSQECSQLDHLTLDNIPITESSLVPTVHVAVVGLNRSLSHTHASIEREIVRPLGRSKAFCSQYSLTLITPPGGRIHNPHSGEEGLVEEDVPVPLDSWARTTVAPEAMTSAQGKPFVPVDSLCDSWQDKEANYTNLKTFLHALHTSYSTHVAPHSADLVVFIRPDVAIAGRLWLRVRLWSVFLRAGKKRLVVYLPSWGRHRGLNDRFAIMSASAAENYFTRGKVADSFFAEGVALNSEKLLAYVLSDATVSNSIYTPMPRVRLGGVYEPLDRRLLTHSVIRRRADMLRARGKRCGRRLMRAFQDMRHSKIS